MSNSRWFLRPLPKPSNKLKLICFPYAGGSAATYLSWSDQLIDDVELIAVQPPGRATRIFESAHSEMTALVSDLLSASKDIIEDPYILFGHSLGSRVAFEFMDHCKKQNLPLPVHFIASGSRGPHIPVRKKCIHHLPDNEFLKEIESLNGTPKEILENDDIMALLLPLLRADFKLADSYQYASDAVFDCPITVFGGKDDTISLADLQSWEIFFSKKADLHVIPGDHFFIENHKNLVIEKVNQIIQRELSTLDL